MDQVADDLAGDYCSQREHTGEKVLGTSDDQVCKLVSWKRNMRGSEGR